MEASLVMAMSITSSMDLLDLTADKVCDTLNMKPDSENLGLLVSLAHAR